MTVVAVAFFVVMVVWAVHGIVQTSRRFDRGVEQARALLTSPELADRGTVKGKIGEHDVSIRMTTRGGDSNAVAWTEIKVAHREVPMKLALRPQTLAESAIVAMSKAVDVQIDDEAMDRAFVIDGAPADAVKRVLDDSGLRRELLALMPVEVEDIGAALQIAKKGWVIDTKLESMLGAIMTLTTRVEALASQPGAAYRDEQGLTRVRAELDALALARARRLRLRKGLLVAFVATFIAAFIVSMTRACH